MNTGKPQKTSKPSSTVTKGSKRATKLPPASPPVPPFQFQSTELFEVATAAEKKVLARICKEVAVRQQDYLAGAQFRDIERFQDANG
jgi:hypothetical protein